MSAGVCVRDWPHPLPLPPGTQLDHISQPPLQFWPRNVQRGYVHLVEAGPLNPCRQPHAFFPPLSSHAQRVQSTQRPEG